MSSTEAPIPQPPLRRRVLRGLAWGAASQVILQISRIVVAVILARLLAPHDYGVAAMVLVFSSLVLVFSDLGLGAALVQRKTLTEADRSTAWWTSVAAGVMFTAVVRPWPARSRTSTASLASGPSVSSTRWCS